MNRYVFVFCLLVPLSLFGNPLHKFEPEQVRSIVVLLSQYDGIPDRSEFSEFRDARKIVTAIATGQGTLQQPRAIAMLVAYWNDDETFRVLVSLIESGKRPISIRKTALRFLATGFVEKANLVLNRYRNHPELGLQVEKIRAWKKNVRY